MPGITKETTYPVSVRLDRSVFIALRRMSAQRSMDQERYVPVSEIIREALMARLATAPVQGDDRSV